MPTAASYEARLAVVEERVSHIMRAVDRIESGQQWIVRLLVTVLITGVASALVTLSIR